MSYGRRHPHPGGVLVDIAWLVALVLLFGVCAVALPLFEGLRTEK
jgi:hypothetical protein